MDPGTNVLDLSQLRRSCSSCALSELCLPAGIGNDDLERLDTAVRDKRGETAEKKFAFEPAHWDDYAGN